MVKTSLLIYRLLWATVTPLIIVRLWLKRRQHPGYWQQWRQRFGYRLDAPQAINGLWIHAVSVGETRAAKPLIDAITRKQPDLPILLSTTTPTGYDTGIALYAGVQVQVVRAPYDKPAVIKRFIAHYQPQALLIMETELWPELILQSAEAGLRVDIVNARLSKRSLHAYMSWPLRGLVRAMLAAIDCIAVRSAEDAAAFTTLGAEAQQLYQLGNVKFTPQQLSPKQQQTQQRYATSQGLKGKRLMVANSTHDGEETLLLKNHTALKLHRPDTLLVLIPRHPERFEQVLALVKTHGLNGVALTDGLDQSGIDVLVVDQMGEVLLWNSMAHAAMMGGSWTKVGGHNPLEAVAFNLPILVGPYTHNFDDMFPPLKQMGVAVEVDMQTDAAEEQLLSASLTALEKGLTAQQQAQLQKWLDEHQPRINEYLNQWMDEGYTG